jgi:hypothetical protein
MNAQQERQLVSIERFWILDLDFWQKASLEQARCLFHKNYGRCLFWMGESHPTDKFG